MILLKYCVQYTKYRPTPERRRCEDNHGKAITSLLYSCLKTCISLHKLILNLFYPHIVHCCVLSTFHYRYDGRMDGP